MEASKSTRKVAADLVMAISKKLPLAISEQFLANVRDGYSQLPLSTMFSGTWTVKQQFTIIRKALEDLQQIDEIRGNMDTIPWQDLSYLLLSSLETVVIDLNVLETRTTQLTEPSPVKSKKATNSIKVSSTKRTGEALSGPNSSHVNAGANPRALPHITDDATITSIQSALINRLREGAIPYDVKANKYVKCRNKDCAFCLQMYHNLDLTACAMFGHAPCTSVGYFPHVGISMWKTLRKQHDAGQPFIPKQDITRKPGDLPRLSEAAKPVLLAAPPISSPTKKRAMSVDRPIYEKKSCRGTSEPPDWSKEVEAANY